MGRRETENNAYAKFWGDKQRALWYVSMVFLEWSILLHDSHALGKKLHIFHDSIVSQFPEKTWAQTKRNREIWPESLRVMLEFWQIERALFSHIKFGKYLIVISRFSSLIFFWLSLQIVNFRFIPVAHQLNFCLAVSLVWATILSVIRASETSHVKEIESIDTISITNYPVEATQQWPWRDGPWRKKGKKIRCANFRGCHQLSHSYWLSGDDASHAPIRGATLGSQLGCVRFWGREFYCK